MRRVIPDVVDGQNLPMPLPAHSLRDATRHMAPQARPVRAGREPVPTRGAPSPP